MSGPSMSLDMRVGQRLEQRQVLSLQTIQSLNILQLATLDLQNLISQELTENPTLDVETGPDPDDFYEHETNGPDPDEQPEPTTAVGETYEEVIEYLQRNTDVDEFVSPSSVTRDDDVDAKQEAFNNLASPSVTLAEHLLDQLRMRNIDALDWPLLEHVCHSLDRRGYLVYPLNELVASLDTRYSLEEAQWALEVVQSLEPRGVGARDLAECLLLQVSPADPDYPALKALLTSHWDDVLKNRVPRLARALKVSVDEVKLLLELLAGLNPHPGAIYSPMDPAMIVPDVVVEEDERGEFQVRLTRENIPRLSLNAYYLRMLKEREGDKETLSFVRNKIQNARQLIDAVEQRQTTLERVARSVVKRQERFLREGVSALAPMKMQDIADEIGIHHSTVWRAVTGKYMECPQGVLAMSELFTGGMPKDDGSVSREAVKLKVKQLVDGEDKVKPLSDMALAKLLAESGVKASRRVVTKYREELGIPDSRVRRSY